jgi:hypothetical protein
VLTGSVAEVEVRWYDDVTCQDYETVHDRAVQEYLGEML